MPRTKTCVLALFLLGMPWPARAQESAGATHTLASARLEQERTFTVHLPSSYATQSRHAYPVLYLLDGEHNLDYSRSVAEFLAQNGLVPEIIIVAVPSGPTRGQDYFPEYASRNGTPGNADRFLAYLAEELVPFIEERYRAAPLRLISGHSLGGTLVTYAMVSRPGVFRGYLTQSPYTDETVGAPLLERLEQALTTSSELDAFFYMTLGHEPDLETNFSRMESLFAAAVSDAFRWVATRDSGKTHMTTRLVGQYEALEGFFAEDWPLTQEELLNGGSVGLERHIEGLSRKYGYPVLYNEQVFQATTQRFLAQRDVPAATGLARLYVRHYETSPPAHFLLGVSLAQGGQREEAAAAIETAIGLYEMHPRADQREMYETMKRVQQQVTGASR